MSAEPSSVPRAPSGTSWSGSNAVVPEDFFPILPWDFHGPARRQGLDTIRDCGFNVAGFILPEHVPVCDALGLRAIANLGVTRSQWVVMTDVQIDRVVKEKVAAFGASPAVIGYYLCDEPEIEEFDAQAKVVAAVKRHAPGKLAYVNLFPEHHRRLDIVRDRSGYSYADYLNIYVDRLRPQFISYDNYTVQYSMDLRDQRRAASYYRNLITARRVARERGLPFWNIVAAHQLRPYAVPPSFANLLFQAWTTLAAGGRGVSWYQYYLPPHPAPTCYAHAAVDGNDRRTPTWRWLQEVNRQIAVLGPVLNRLDSTGVYFTNPPAEGCEALPGRLVAACTVETPVGIKDANAALPAVPPPDLVIERETDSTTVMIGEFAGASGERLAVFVNLSLERSAKIAFETAPGAQALGLVSTEDASLIPFTKRNEFWLTSGQGVAVRFDARTATR